MTNKTFRITALTSAVLILSTGCATTSLQTQSKVTRSIVIDQSKMQKKNLYLQVTNTANLSNEKFNLLNSLKNKLQNKGYQIVTSSKEAEFGLFVNVLYANNIKEINTIKGGTIAGTTGLIAGASSGLKDGLIVGAVMGLGGALVGKLTEDDIFRAALDIKIRDYTSQDIEVYKSTQVGNSSFVDKRRSGFTNQFAGKLGQKNGSADMNSGINEKIDTKSVKDYEEYTTRAFVEATKLNLSLDEALPILAQKASSQIANLF